MADGESSTDPGTDSDAAEQAPKPTRYRCTACGNLTRFDVTASRRTREFHHYDVSGQLDVETSEVLSEVVEEVSCRWCGNGSAVVEADPGTPSSRDDGAPAETGW